ncbi:MAG: NAD(P)H-hydrate dehydratase, partial [Rufibacter sp.]
MKILSAAQTREADAYTIAQEPISSLDLMERAASALAAWLEEKFGRERPFYLFCGPGNNGGDGLAVARLLHQHGYEVFVFLADHVGNRSADFTQNLERLPPEINCSLVSTPADFPALSSQAVAIDALFGSGLSRPLQGVHAQLVEHLNTGSAAVVALDVPSGLFTDEPTPAGSAVVEATYTVTFESPKLAFLLPQAGKYVGQWQAVPIGLHASFLASVVSPYELLSRGKVRQLLRPRAKFSHKGTYGHALMIGGSYGKMGALVLSSRAALRAGVGLLTVQVPAVGYSILQTAVPEAMALTDEHDHYFTSFPEELGNYQALGIGPGLGLAEASRIAMEHLFRRSLPPLVLDADALNLLAADRMLLRNLPAESILTPHPKEFERLTGPAQHDFHRLELLKAFCREHSCYVVLKGAHTCIGTPTGEYFFNSTGNPGMATGGTG